MLLGRAVKAAWLGIEKCTACTIAQGNKLLKSSADIFYPPHAPKCEGRLWANEEKMLCSALRGIATIKRWTWGFRPLSHSQDPNRRMVTSHQNQQNHQNQGGTTTPIAKDSPRPPNWTNFRRNPSTLFRDNMLHIFPELYDQRLPLFDKKICIGFLDWNWVPHHLWVSPKIHPYCLLTGTGF